jgi:4-amino-4-deoxy-L-arabinose transferase-like glycosyltransferase
MAVRVAIVALCGVLLLGGLTAGELYRNEGLRARLAWEALAGGDWLVPTLYGQPHLTKPPGMPVLIALASWPAGRVTPVTARLPSVVAGACAIALVGWAVGRCSGARAGWLAAAVLPCAPLWLDRVPSAEIDLVQLGWVTPALLFALRAAEDDSFAWWLLALLCVAGGFFTKWTAPAFFYLTVVPFLWRRGQLGQLARPPHLVSVLVLLSLAGAWLVLVGQSAGWGALGESLFREAMLRLSPRHHPRPYPWSELATFPLGFLGGCMPWSLIALPALRPSFARLLNARERNLRLLALTWLVSSVAFWTVVPGHRPRHILPAQPAVAILAALVCLTWLDGRLAWRLRLAPARALGGVLAGWVVAKMVWIGVVVPARLVGRDAQAGAALLARQVPDGDVLRLIQLKDDGLLFYYGRDARRASNAAPEPGAWYLLTEEEWRAWQAPADAVARLKDSQGDPLVLVRARHAGARPCATGATCWKE